MPDKATVVVVGDEGSGKSALTLQAISHFPQAHEPTADDCIRKLALVDDEECIIDIMDTGGRQESRTIAEQWMDHGEAFVLVYDVASRRSFQNIRPLHDQVRRVKGGDTPNTWSNSAAAPVARASQYIPAVLVGNKKDLTEKRVVSEEEGTRLAKELECAYIEASARDNVNVAEIYITAVRLLRRKRRAGDDGQVSIKEGHDRKRVFWPFHRRDGSLNCAIL